MANGKRNYADSGDRDPIEIAFRKFRNRGKRNNLADDVFLEIEGSYPSSIEKLKKYVTNEAEKNYFCSKYIIKIVLDFAGTQIDKDLLLAVFGLLQGYNSSDELNKRRDLYCKTVGQHDEGDGQDKPYYIYWHQILPNGKKNKSFYRNISAKEDAAIRRLVKAVRREMDSNNCKLGYANDDSKIAEIISMEGYPEPLYLFEETYRKCTYGSDIFYVPLTEAEMAKKVQDNSHEAETGQNPPLPDDPPIDPPPDPGIDDMDDDPPTGTEPTTGDEPEPLPPGSPSPEPPSPKPIQYLLLEWVKRHKILTVATIGLLAGVAAAAIAFCFLPRQTGKGVNNVSDYDGRGWGDNGGFRESYTVNEINAGALGDQIIFNTISDSEMGNEKNFVGARKYTGINAGVDNVWEGNDIVVEDGQEYIIRLYVHNNNRDGYNGVAEDTRVSFSIPSESSTHITVNGFIMSSNATPSKYWDYVTFHGASAFHLEYFTGSALLENRGIGKGGLVLSDAVVDAASGGSPIGFDSLDGRIPGGYTYSSFITIHVRAVFDLAYTIEHQVRLADSEDKTWGNSVDAQIGDIVEFRVAYMNNDTFDHLNVMIKDILPDGLEYVPGSTKLVNGTYPDGSTVDQDTITTTGINIGGYGAGANAFVRFRAKVVDEELVDGGKTELVSWAQGGLKGAVIQDYAVVVVQKD